MGDFSGTPAEVKIWMRLDGVTWTPVWGDYVPREGITISTDASQKTKQVAFPVVTENGADLNIQNKQQVRVEIDDDYQLTGFVEVVPTTSRGNTKTYALTVTNGSILLSNGPNAQITERITIPPGQSDHTVIAGGTFVLDAWAPNANHLIGDYAEPSPANGSYYRITPAEPDVWTPNTVYAVKDFRQDTVRSGKVLKVTAITTGKSGPTEPPWATLTVLGNTLTEGGVTWRYDADMGITGMVQPIFPTGVGQTVADGAFVWECLGSKVWAGLGATYFPEVSVAGLATLISSNGELVFEKMTALDALELLRQQAVGSVAWDWYVDTDPDTGVWVLRTVDWNNTTSVPETAMAFIEGQPVSATVAGWLPDTFERTLWGQPLNAVTVWGPSGAKGTIDGSVAAPKVWTPNLGTNRLQSNGHGFTDGTIVYLSNPTGGSHNLPHPLRAYQSNGLPQAYYVAGATANTFYLTYVPGGNQITFKSAGGAGTYYVVDARYDPYAKESYDLYGKWTAAQIVLDSPIYADNDACREYGRDFVRYNYRPKDNIRLSSRQRIDPAILRAPRVASVTNTIEGLDDTSYPVRRVTLSFPNGIALWNYELGDEFEVDGQPPNFGRRFGQTSPGDTSPPDQITDLHYLTNIYNPSDDDSYIRFGWTNSRARDFRRSQISYTIQNTNIVNEPMPPVERPGHEITLRAFPGRVYDVQIAAYDQAGNAYQPPAPYQVTAAPRGLHHTYNPNFVQRNRISGEPAPEGWFDVLGSGSTIAHRGNAVVLASLTNGGAHIESDKQRVNGGDAFYTYTLEVQAVSDISSRIVVDVSCYEETIEGLPGALISTQAALASTTVTSALLTRHIPLTVPSTSRFLSIKGGIPSGVTTQPLTLLKLAVQEEFVPPTPPAPIVTVSGSASGVFNPASGLSEVQFAVAAPPNTDYISSIDVYVFSDGVTTPYTLGPTGGTIVASIAPGEDYSTQAVAYNKWNVPSAASAPPLLGTAASYPTPTAPTISAVDADGTYNPTSGVTEVEFEVDAPPTSDYVSTIDVYVFSEGVVKTYTLSAQGGIVVATLTPGATYSTQGIAYNRWGQDSPPSTPALTGTAAARPIPDTPGTPDYSAYEINRLSADGRIATVGVLFEKSTSPNVVRHELFSPWVTYPEGQIVEDAILPLEVSDDDPAHSIGEFEIEPGTIIATPSVRVIDARGIPSAWSPASTETITAASAPHDDTTNLTADRPDSNDQDGAFNWKRSANIIIAVDTVGDGGRHWHCDTPGTSAFLYLLGWRAAVGHLHELQVRDWLDSLSDTGSYLLALRQWISWESYKAGDDPEVTVSIGGPQSVESTTPTLRKLTVEPQFPYVELRLFADPDSKFNIDFVRWQDMDGIGETEALSTPDKVLVLGVNYVHAQADAVEVMAIDAQDAIDTHAALTNNPHSTTAAQVGADPTGTAAAAITTHVGLSDPHTQYHTDARGDARYPLKSGKTWLTNITSLDTPASPTAYDDEFPGATLDAKWGWTNQGAGGELASVAVAGGYARLSIPGSGASDVRLLKQTAPSGAFSIIAGPFSLGRGTVFANEAWGGIFIGEATPGKFVQIVLGQDNSQQRLIQMQKWNTPTSWNANVLAMITGQGRHPIEPLWLRLDYNGTSTFTAFITADPNANEWWAFASDATTFLTPSSIGIVAHNSSASTSDVLTVRVDAFRRFS